MDILTGAEMAKAAIDGALSTAEKGAGLIGKWNQGLGVLFSPGGKKHDEEEAVRYYIEEIKKDPDMPRLVKAQKIAQARQDLKAFINQATIVQDAVEQLSEDEKSEQIDDGWLSYFLDAAKHVYEDDVQAVWSRLLANECEQPGSVPKTVIQILSLIDSDTARKFEVLCGFVIENLSCNAFPIIDIRKQLDYIIEAGLNLNALLEIQRIGLITLETVSGFALKQGYLTFVYPPKSGRLKNIGYMNNPKKESINIGACLFTKAGECLYKAIQHQPRDDFFDYLGRFADARHMQIDDAIKMEIEFTGPAPAAPEAEAGKETGC